MITIIILFLLASIAKHLRDEIAYHPDKSIFPSWKWYNENRWETKSWWLKNPLSFLLDGWHFMESIVMAILSTYATMLLAALYNIPIWLQVVIGILLYAFTGTLHSLLDGSLLRYLKKKKSR